MASSEEAWKTYFAKLEAYQQQQARVSAAAQAAASSSSVPVSGAYQQQPAPPRSVPVSGAYQQQPAPPRSFVAYQGYQQLLQVAQLLQDAQQHYGQSAASSSVPAGGAYQQQPAPPRSARAAAGEEQPASEFFWDQLPTDALTMIIREAADMRLFAATSKAVRELAINSFYELEIGDYFDDEYETRFWPSGHWQAAPWVASNVSWPSSLKRVRINYRRLDALPQIFFVDGRVCLSRRHDLQSPELLKLRDHMNTFGDGFSGVRKLEVGNVRPVSLHLMLKKMPSVDWLSLLNTAPVRLGSDTDPSHREVLRSMCKVVRSVKPALRHLYISTDAEEDFGDALMPLADRESGPSLPELRTLVLRLGGDTNLTWELLQSWPKLKYFHANATISDHGLYTLVDTHPELESVSFYGLDDCSLRGLTGIGEFESSGAPCSLTALSLVNCMGITPEALIALAGVHPLRKLAIAFLDFKETEVNFNMADLFRFAASCPLLEELQLGEFRVGYVDEEEEEELVTVTLELEHLLVLEHACPKLRRFIIPGTTGYTTFMEDLLVSTEGVANLPRLNRLMERAKNEDDVDWGEMAARKAFASAEVLAEAVM